MQVTRVHLNNINGKQFVIIESTDGYMEDSMPISETMAKCLTVDIINQIAAGRGGITPTPWGWQWCSCYTEGMLPVPETIYYQPTDTQLLDAVFGSPTLRYPERR